MFPHRIKTSFTLVGLLFVSAPGLALADEPPAPTQTPTHFGDSGQFALHLNDGLSESGGDLVAGPEIQADYFVAPHVSLGLMVGANWFSSSVVENSSSSNFAFRVGPRIGYDIPLSEYVSWWPQVGVDYRSLSTSTSSSASAVPAGEAVQSTSSTNSAFAFTAIAPILIHPSRGFFVGAGPSFYTEISNSTSSGSVSADNSKVTSVGLMATIGGAI